MSNNTNFQFKFCYHEGDNLTLHNVDNWVTKLKLFTI